MSESVLAPPQRKLGEMLVEAGLLTLEQVEQAVREATRLRRRLGE